MIKLRSNKKILTDLTNIHTKSKCIKAVPVQIRQLIAELQIHPVLEIFNVINRTANSYQRG